MSAPDWCACDESHDNGGIWPAPEFDVCECCEPRARLERYEVALRLIANVPKDHHVQQGDLPPWESTVLLDGHDQCVEIAKRALEGEV